MSGELSDCEWKEVSCVISVCVNGEVNSVSSVIYICVNEEVNSLITVCVNDLGEQSDLYLCEWGGE